MFLDLNNNRPDRHPPRPGRRKLSRREEAFFVWLLIANVVVLLIAPVGGASIVQGVMALFR